MACSSRRRMKPCLRLCLALLISPLATLAQTPAAASSVTVRDRLWIFTVVEGGNNKKSPASPNGNAKHYIDDFAPGGSRMTPAEGAFWLGVPNLLFIRSNNLPAAPADEVARRKTSYQQYATSFQPLERVVWSTVGAGGEGGMGELPATLSLAREFPNIQGIFLDDFVRPIPRKKATDAHTGRPAMPLADLRRLREQTKTIGRPLDIWVTLYTHEINPERKASKRAYIACDPPLADFLGEFDVLTLWTWDSTEIPELEANLLALEKIAPKKARIALGIYLWDFQNKKPVSVELMKHQCDLGLKWLKEGRISDMIFLANTMLDVGMPSADFSRQWIKEHGGEKLRR
jgi:hypothetical protein